MIRVGPTAMTDVPIRRYKFGHTQKRYKIGGEHHQRRKAEMGLMCLQAKECQGLQKLGRGKEGCYLLLASGAVRGKKKSLLFSAILFMVICYGSLRKLT